MTFSEKNPPSELESQSATLSFKAPEIRPPETSVLNKDNESIKLVGVEEWIKNLDTYEKLVPRYEVGVCVEPSDNVHLLKDSLDLIELIALDFHNFDDGRGYSQAHLLNRWGYTGEIIGINAHIDQLQFMIRSGVTSYRLQEQYKEYDESDYADGFSICYQSAANNSGLNERFKKSLDKNNDT